MTNLSPLEPLLVVRNLGKLFSRGQADTQRRIAREVFAALMGRTPGNDAGKSGFWALRDVSFSLQRGQAIGIIGFNGAGKTTLLRLLTGQILPDAGEVVLNGKAAALVDLVAGMQQALPGRENVYLRSAVLGRSRAETRRLFDDIVAFAEIGDAIDAPLSSYSSGMKLRLAFATTIFTRPDILIVDEVLSVGDFRFRQKCLEYVRSMREQTAFVLVSHSMGDISRFCDTVLVLEKGEIAFRGSPADAIAYYESRQPGNRPAAKDSASFFGNLFHNENALGDFSFSWLDADGRAVTSITQGDPVRLSIRFSLAHAPKKLIVGIPIYNHEGRMLTAVSSEQSGYDIVPTSDGTYRLIVDIASLPLVPGTYHPVVAVVDGPEFLYRQRQADLVVVPGSAARYFGDLVIDQTWSSEDHDSSAIRTGTR